MHSSSQHSIIWWSDHCAFHQSTLHNMVVRSACIPPVNTVLYGGQSSMHSTSQHSIIWWSNHCAFHQSTQYYMVVRSACTPPVNTVLYGGQISMHSSSQHSIIWWSDHSAFHQSTQYYMVVTPKACLVGRQPIEVTLTLVTAQHKTLYQWKLKYNRITVMSMKYEIQQNNSAEHEIWNITE